MIVMQGFNYYFEYKIISASVTNPKVLDYLQSNRFYGSARQSESKSSPRCLHGLRGIHLCPPPRQPDISNHAMRTNGKAMIVLNHR